MVYLLIDIDGSDVHGIVSELVHAVIFIYDGVMYVLYDKSDLHVVSKETLESTKHRMVASACSDLRFCIICII